MRPSGILLVVILLCLTPGCGGEQDSSAPERTVERTADQSSIGSATAEMTERAGDAPATKVIVTSKDSSLPDGCEPRRAALLVSDFVDAFNQGDGAALSRIFFISEGPSPPDFSDSSIYPWSWYSVSEIGEGGRIEDGFTTYDQRDLLRYFDRRHDRGERLRLLKVGLTGPGMLGERGNVGFVYVLTRKAGDLEAGMGGPDGVAVGKGAMNCSSRRIFAWSMDMRRGETRDSRAAARWLCSNPPGWNPGDAVIACA